jgi:hypothetical protein
VEREIDARALSHLNNNAIEVANPHFAQRTLMDGSDARIS